MAKCDVRRGRREFRTGVPALGLSALTLRAEGIAAQSGVQGEARAARRGLWGDREPVPPWDRRRRQRSWRKKIPLSPIPFEKKVDSFASIGSNRRMEQSVITMFFYRKCGFNV
jgi:hypothetical protein